MALYDFIWVFPNSALLWVLVGFEEILHHLGNSVWTSQPDRVRGEAWKAFWFSLDEFVLLESRLTNSSSEILAVRIRRARF